MNIAIIGCGYVGSALAVALVGKGHSVTVTTRSPEKVDALTKIASSAAVIEGSDPIALHQVLNGKDIIIITVAAGNIESYESTYLGTAKAVAEACKLLPDLKQIIYTSSTSVYGDHGGAVVDETVPPSPMNPSGKILVETEQTLLSLSTPQRKVCVLRLGEIIGPGRNPLDRLKKMQGIPLPGDGSSFVNRIERDEIIATIEFCIDSKLDGIFNLCSDDHPTRKELYDSLCLQENLDPMRWDPTKISLHSGNKKVSSDKIKEKRHQRH